jgi:hypothetical protein
MIAISQTRHQPLRQKSRIADVTLASGVSGALIFSGLLSAWRRVASVCQSPYRAGAVFRVRGLKVAKWAVSKVHEKPIRGFEERYAKRAASVNRLLQAPRAARNK